MTKAELKASSEAPCLTIGYNVYIFQLSQDASTLQCGAVT